MREIKQERDPAERRVVANFREAHVRLLSDVREACALTPTPETAEAIELMRTLRVVARAYINEQAPTSGQPVDLDEFITAVTS
jgi:hypothetical protein